MKYTIGKISTAIPRTVQGNFRRLLSSPHQPTEVGRPRIARSCAIKSAGFFILGSVKPRSSGRGYKRLGRFSIRARSSWHTVSLRAATCGGITEPRNRRGELGFFTTEAEK